jgi:hypothetical protein
MNQPGGRGDKETGCPRLAGRYKPASAFAALA